MGRWCRVLPEREEGGRVGPSGGVPWMGRTPKKGAGPREPSSVADPAREQSGKFSMGMSD